MRRSMEMLFRLGLLAGRKAQLSLFAIRAPFDRMIAHVKVQIGDMVTQVPSMLGVEDPLPRRIAATVSVADIRGMKPDNPVALNHDHATSPAATGRIHRSQRN